MILLRIFAEFCKIGVISFGGGNAIFPILHREVVENLHWITEQDFLNMVSIAETTPGPIGMNLSTFIGFKLAGLLGAVVATLAYDLPSFLIMLGVVMAVAKVKENRVYKGFVSTIMVVVLVLLMRAVQLIAQGGFHEPGPYLVAVIAFAVFLRWSKLNPIYSLLACGAAGMAFF